MHLMMMTESKQAKSDNFMFVDIRRAHLHSTSEDECLWSCFQQERGEVGVLCFSLNSTYATRDAAVTLASTFMDTWTNMKFEVGHVDLCWCKHASKVIGRFYHGDDFVILADETALQSFATELDEALDREGLWSAGGRR